MRQIVRKLALVEESQLLAYRRAAHRLHSRVWPYSAHHFTATVLRRGRPDEASLIPESDFIALLVAFRIIHAKKELTNFHRIASLLHRVGDKEVVTLAASFREAWDNSFKPPILFSLDGEHFDARAILDTWMNGEVFHQKAELQYRVERLRTMPALTMLILQCTVRDACFAALGLDNTVALVLDEPFREVPSSSYTIRESESDGTM